MWDALRRRINDYVAEAADICDRALLQEVIEAYITSSCAPAQSHDMQPVCRTMLRHLPLTGVHWQPPSRQQQNLQQVVMLSRHRHLPCACFWAAIRTARRL